MRIPVFIAGLMIPVFAGLSYRDRTADDSIFRSVRLIVNSPVLLVNEQSRQVVTMSDTIEVICSGGYTLFCFPAKRSIPTNQQVPGTATYFFYKEGRERGILYRSLSDNTSAIGLNVDSFLNLRAYRTLYLGPNPGKLVDCQRSVDNVDLAETYIPLKVNGNSTDSLYLYFSAKFNDLNYSLSRSLDSLRHKKLYKVRLLFNGKKLVTTNCDFPNGEFVLELQPGKINDPALMADVFERWMR